MFAKTKKRNRPMRKRKTSESTDDEKNNEVEESSSTNDVVGMARELQKIRKRQTGVSATALATGAKVTKLDELFNSQNDPFKLETGGLVIMKNVKDRNRDRTYEDVDRDVTNLGSIFSVETNRRDEDAELSTYIENELKKLKGETDSSENDQRSRIKMAEDALYQLPEHLQVKVNKQSEEMLSNQMLSGIPEIDLGIETKIKNIERTEEAKQKLIQDLSKKREKTKSFVPTNVAVNYVQHKRFLQQESIKKKKIKEQAPEPVPLVVGDKERRMESESQKKTHNKDNSTDNFHYDKFRKAVRR